jgi:hypothetical protein
VIESLLCSQREAKLQDDLRCVERELALKLYASSLPYCDRPPRKFIVSIRVKWFTNSRYSKPEKAENRGSGFHGLFNGRTLLA